MDSQRAPQEIAMDTTKKLFRVKVVNAAGQQADILFQANDLADVEFAVSSDPDNLHILDIEMLGIVESPYHGPSVVNASAFRKQAEHAKGGYAGLDFSQAFPPPLQAVEF
jgi:hypothetical protein